ncbi:MAG: hypothetical protein HY912_01115 [Desulfomonile tiedjei]|uniref:PilZ domain-containing protein n=1 Tax=Desulfomonile tiedjei TaxID=2358 RepID=A0A9D6YYT4_9BACT|nr:hypothetical protein [Desulfomonile tiedjei]
MESKRKIKAKDIVNDIRAHMTDSELMAKYNLSARGLQSVFVKLLNTNAITKAEIDWRPSAYDDTVVIQQVKTTDMVHDIRSGLTDYELMDKYSVSSEGLQKAFQSLLQVGGLRPEELYGRSPSQDDTVFIECLRELPRHYLAVAVAIYEPKHPEAKGALRDITEKGVGITGIAARIGEVKTLEIPAEGFIEADRIVFEAKCVWVQTEDSDEQPVAGFQIISISEKSFEDLRMLIKSVCFSG